MADDYTSRYKREGKRSYTKYSGQLSYIFIVCIKEDSNHMYVYKQTVKVLIKNSLYYKNKKRSFLCDTYFYYRHFRFISRGDWTQVSMRQMRVSQFFTNYYTFYNNKKKKIPEMAETV